MIDTLQPKDSDLSRALATWPCWSVGLSRSPAVDTELTRGRTNQTYLLKTHLSHHSKVVLRIFSKRSRAYGICRKTEQTIHNAVAAINCAPTILHWDNRIGFCVVEYVSGKTWDKTDFEDELSCLQLAQVIRRYQNINLKGIEKFNYQAHLLHYAKLGTKLLSNEELTQWQRFQSVLACWQSHPWPRAITHHDLIPENIIETPCGLKIIDWEYAGLGNPNLDWINLPNHDITSQDERLFLEQLQFWLNRFWESI